MKTKSVGKLYNTPLLFRVLLINIYIYIYIYSYLLFFLLLSKPEPMRTPFARWSSKISLVKAKTVTLVPEGRKRMETFKPKL